MAAPSRYVIESPDVPGSVKLLHFLPGVLVVVKGAFPEVDAIVPAVE
jgi:hypothetical protein